LERDEDSARKATNLSKVAAYSLLESPPNPEKDDVFLRQIGNSRDPNEVVDNWILYAPYRNAVHYLITEDRDLQRKAERAGIREKVLSVDEACKLLGKAQTRSALRYPPALSILPVHNLKLEDPFFDSLKKDYPGFEDWFNRVSEEGREAIVYFEENGGIGAILMTKAENEAVNSQPPLSARRRLKIATLKVAHQGYKIGELFIKLAVQEAIAKNCEELYLTHFTTQEDELIDLVSDYGFGEIGRFPTGERVFAKGLYPDTRASALSPLAIATKYYPAFYDGQRVRKFILPIRPEYHEKLFVDYADRQTTLLEHSGQFIVEGNTIKKAYLCNSNNKMLLGGDVLLFYRSLDERSLTSLGTVESVHYKVKGLERVARLVEKRTVYSIGEIQQMLHNPTMVILFKWHLHLPHPVSLQELSSMNISIPQTITRMSHSNYLRIKSRGGIDGRLTVN
jgi:hypothetical protein